MLIQTHPPRRSLGLSGKSGNLVRMPCKSKACDSDLGLSGTLYVLTKKRVFAMTQFRQQILNLGEHCQDSTVQHKSKMSFICMSEGNVHCILESAYRTSELPTTPTPSQPVR